jgi:Sec-independent protein translocase protein TatA
MARNLGKGIREFKEAISMDSHDDDDEPERLERSKKPDEAESKA